MALLPKICAKFEDFTFGTFTVIPVGSINTLGPIQTGCARTLIIVYLAHFTAEA